MAEKEITLDELFNAIEKNGLRKVIGKYLDWDIPYNWGENAAWNERNRRIVAGCALGQAALNLNVRPQRLADSIDKVSPVLRDAIIELNDVIDLSLPEIAHALRMKYTSRFRQRKITVEVD